jgi:hypothetical protein
LAFLNVYSINVLKSFQRYRGRRENLKINSILRQRAFSMKFFSNLCSFKKDDGLLDGEDIIMDEWFPNAKAVRVSADERYLSNIRYKISNIIYFYSTLT